MKKIILLTLIIFCSALYAQYKIERIVSGSGGGISAGTNFKVMGTAGQMLIGKPQSSLFQTNSGFWYTYSAITGINDGEQLPDKYMLYQNYPNPFNPSTKIKYQLPEEAMVSLRIYNIIGEEIAVLVNSVQPAGNYTLEWNASGLSSGLYIYRIEAGTYISVKKLILLK